MIRPSRLALAALALASPAAAQTFNIDIGADGTPVPSSSYGAALGSTGVWNAVDPNGATVQPPVVLVDTSGNATGVTLELPLAGGIQANNACLAGEEAALLDDLLGAFPVAGVFRFEGLADGPYTVVTYALASDDFTITTDVEVVGSNEGAQVVGGVDPCTLTGLVQGAHYALHTVNVVGGILTVEYAWGATDFAGANGFQILPGFFSGLGQNYCTAVPNSTGQAGVMSATGSINPVDNNVTLTASNLPTGQFGIFVTSRAQGFVPMAGGNSNGNLCVGGTIGRFVGPGQIQSTGTDGSFSLSLDLGALPQGAGTVAVQSGESWNFQAWHRDGVGLGSNLSDGLEIQFL